MFDNHRHLVLVTVESSLYTLNDTSTVHGQLTKVDTPAPTKQ